MPHQILACGVFRFRAPGPASRKGTEVPSERIRTITEIGLAVALVAALKAFGTVYRLPEGGSVSLEMAPIFLIALRRGLDYGVITGILGSIVVFLLEPMAFHPAQLFVDYPLAFGLVGVGGAFAGRWQRLATEAIRTSDPGLIYLGQLTAILPAVILGSGLRFAAHVASGVLFFAAYAPAGQNVWVYSLLYNGAYMLPTTIVTAIVLWIAQPILDRAVPVARV
jgi:thiamine transporter